MDATSRNRLLRGLIVPGAALLAAAGLAFSYADGGDSGWNGAAGSAGTGVEPTYYADVLPILKQNCVECHSAAGRNIGGMVAPMAFTTYEETRPWAPLIAAAVKDGRMPPWDAAPEFRGKFRNERWLDAADKATLLAWVEAGAPAGDPSTATVRIEEPEVHDHGQVWSIGTPDLVIGFREPFLVGDEVDDLQLTIPVRVSAEDHPEPRWIRRAELLPGSHIVHHILAWPIAGIAHGVPPIDYDDGYGVLLPAGPLTIQFQMHYNKQPGPGTAVEDLSRGGIIFYEEGEVIRHVVRQDPLGMFDFVIPAGASDYSASMDYVFEEDVYILGFLPHMHLRGKAAKYEITHPDGKHEVLLHVPDYNFDWQHNYQFRDPVFAPAGAKVTMTLWWDNSEGNPHNPDPTIDVYWGAPTWDEMGYGFMTFVRAEPIHHVVGDPIPDDVPPYLVRPLSPNFDDLPPQAIERMRERGDITDEDLERMRQMRQQQGAR